MMQKAMVIKENPPDGLGRNLRRPSKLISVYQDERISNPAHVRVLPHS